MSQEVEMNAGVQWLLSFVFSLGLSLWDAAALSSSFEPL